MKTRTLTVVAASLLALSACKEDKAAAPATAPAATDTKPAAEAKGPLVTQDQKVSYILGMNIGRQFQANGVPLDYDSFVTGMKDGTANAEPKLSQEDIQKTMMAFQEQMEKKRAEEEQKRKVEMEAAANRNKDEGLKFLETNKGKAGVKTTASGLQYEVVQEGTGPKPQPTDTVTVHYVGTLIDGTEFDSSIKRNEPATFAVNAVIPGWQEALQLMAEGSKYKLVIPSELAYGPGGTGGAIGPNAVLQFDVELIKVNPEPVIPSEEKASGADIGSRPASSKPVKEDK